MSINDINQYIGQYTERSGRSNRLLLADQIIVFSAESPSQSQTYNTRIKEHVVQLLELCSRKPQSMALVYRNTTETRVTFSKELLRTVKAASEASLQAPGTVHEIASKLSLDEAGASAASTRRAMLLEMVRESLNLAEEDEISIDPTASSDNEPLMTEEDLQSLLQILEDFDVEQAKKMSTQAPATEKNNSSLLSKGSRKNAIPQKSETSNFKGGKGKIDGKSSETMRDKRKGLSEQNQRAVELKNETDHRELKAKIRKDEEKFAERITEARKQGEGQ